jgi:hypothetical protein
MAMLQLLLSKQDLAEVKAFVVMTGEVERGLIDSATATHPGSQQGLHAYLYEWYYRTTKRFDDTTRVTYFGYEI